METYYVSYYIFFTIIIILFALIKGRTTLNALKLIRLLNFFFVIPCKIFGIFFGFYMYLELLTKMFFMIFQKTNKSFPSIMLFVLNYGIIMVLCVYALFGQELFSLFIMFAVFSFVLSALFSRPLNYSVFPYKVKNISWLRWIYVIFLVILMILFIIPIAYAVSIIYRYDLVEVIEGR